MIDITDDELLENVTNLLIGLADVSAGDYSARVNVAIEDAEHPLVLICDELNRTIDAIRAEAKLSADVQRELEARLVTIELQRAAIRELSAPIIEIWEGVLCLPVVGTLDTIRSVEMSESVLAAVAKGGARFVIVDVTGISAIDTATANQLIRLASAVRLLGANALLSGIGADIAQTITHMGVELTDIATFATLRGAVGHAIAALRAL